MGAALALAVLLVVVVGVLSLAVNAQGPVPGARQVPGGATRGQQSSRSSHPGSGPPSPRAPRRPPREPRERGERQEKAERRSERQSQPEASSGGASAPSASPIDDPTLFTDVKPLNSQAQALVISVVDERTLGPVTRSRLTLRVEPAEGEAFEVTTRVAFPTPEERAKVKVGATISVRYDSEDHRRVVIGAENEAPE